MSTISWIPPQVNQGTTTSWLPVTSAYPSLSGCASAFFEFPGQANPVGWDPGYGYFAGAALSCGPPEQTKWWEQAHEAPDGYTTLSIQPIVCPAAFTTAATQVVSGSSTNVRCCPSGYNLVGGQPGRLVGDCYSSLSSGELLTYTVRNETDFLWFQTVLTVTAASSIWAIPMDGWNVTPSPSTSSLSTPTSTSASNSNTASESKSSAQLSTGARAGIGAGIAVFVIAVICLIFLFFRRKRRSRPDSYAETQPPPPVYYNQAQPVPQPQQSPWLSEADSRYQKPSRAEMSVQPMRKYRDPAELETR